MNPEGLPAAEVLTFGETMGSIRASGLLRHGRAQVLHLTGITPALSPAAAEAALWAARAAKDAGALVSFDVNYRSKLWDRDTAAAALRPLADLADVIIASEDELGLVLREQGQGQTGWNAARELYRRGVRDVIIKRGAQGARGYSGAAVIDQPALDVRAVDTVGAGDAFTAGYLSALLDGETLERRLRRGVILGAFAVAASGDWENLPTRDELALAGHTAGSTIR
jgi:2-dehydro-3-deoxygluconokinase